MRKISVPFESLSDDLQQACQSIRTILVRPGGVVGVVVVSDAVQLMSVYDRWEAAAKALGVWHGLAHAYADGGDGMSKAMRDAIREDAALVLPAAPSYDGAAGVAGADAGEFGVALVATTEAGLLLHFTGVS